MAQGHEHPARTSEHLGSVHFATSCDPRVAPAFNHAIALLHSFEFGAAIRGFDEVLAADSSCAMAYWGIAMSGWSNPMAPGVRSATMLQPGRAAAVAATSHAGGATSRERGYIAAVNELYSDYEHRDQRTRMLAYETAMRTLAASQPADTEAQIFHALSLVASASPTDKSYAKQRVAGATLERLWVAEPDHPGLAHYIIHAYDVPALAPQARAAAERYAAIAPSAAHALHMPSHIFTRVGMWRESIATNQRSIESAMQSGAIAEALHASDYAVYAMLQLTRTADAQSILDRLPALASRFDPNAVTGAAPGSAGAFALAAIPARVALEQRDWKTAAELQPAQTPFRYADAVTWFARSLGAAHGGDTAAARAGIDTLGAIHDVLVGAGESYWAEQVAIQQLETQASLDQATGSAENALRHMREAAAREDATEKSAVTPGPLAPAHELLGDLLVELNQPADALAEYETTLTKEPNRYRSLYGATIAARAAGDSATSSRYDALIASMLAGSPH